ncbi:hypothetical protein ILYODFUR_007212 [Ilyodon furcidens]|uniref:Uncharacterized protein n=1 Tax=Ilyodon furcidens TaxID=33524 RepID=A0ABV0SVB2_9TELE
MKQNQLLGVRRLKAQMREKEAALFSRLLDLQTPCCQSALPSIPWGNCFPPALVGGVGGWRPGKETIAGGKKKQEHIQTDAECCGSMCICVCVCVCMDNIFARHLQ